LTAEGHCEEIQHGYVESFNQFDAVTVFFGKTLNVVFKIVDERNGHPNTIRSDQEQRSVLKFRRNGGQSCQGFAGDAVLAKQLIESRSRRRKRGERRQGLIEYGKWFRAELGENHQILANKTGRGFLVCPQPQNLQSGVRLLAQRKKGLQQDL
jgi:hypothetical protein